MVQREYEREKREAERLRLEAEQKDKDREQKGKIGERIERSRWRINLFGRTGKNYV